MSTLTPHLKIDHDSALRHTDGLLKTIRHAHENGKAKKADHFSCLFLNSLDAKYTAAVSAYRDLKKHRRPRDFCPSACAHALDPWVGTNEPVLLRPKEKENGCGELRHIMDFGIENRALQHLALSLLKTRAAPHPNQYTMQGTHAAIQRVRDHMLSGYKWAMETDIKDCYPSFDGKKVPGLLPLPKRVTQMVLLSESMNVTLGNKSIFGPAGPEENNDLLFSDVLADARRGFPQGSATSPLTVEMLLAPIFAALPTSGAVVGYADNILIMGETDSDVASMTLSLWSALKAHPAGHLRPKEPKPFYPGTPIDFLGHRLRKAGNEVSIEPLPKNLAKFHKQFAERSKRIASLPPKARHRDLKELTRYVRSWTSMFKLWDGAAHLRKTKLQEVKKMGVGH